MLKLSDRYKSIFWHIHKTGGSYVEYVLDRYYDFDIKWEEMDNEMVDKVHVVIKNDEDFMKHVKDLE